MIRLLCLLLLSGCAALPPHPQPPPSTALDTAQARQTSLGRLAADALPSAALSGFRMLPLAASAYETRLELAGQAERTLDLQTFVYNGDATGAWLLGALRDAAQRGVRVRLLIDDLHTDSAEALLSDLAAFPGVEVRLVNPFVRARGSRTAKLASSLDQLSRVNHRMHNKLLVADNALVVFGGRNIGDEYFMRSRTSGNFVDLDMLAAGPVVAQLSASFDRYWNSAHAYPIDSIVAPQGTPPQRQARFDAARASFTPPRPDLGVPARLAAYATVPAELRQWRLTLLPAAAEVMDDPVDKLAGTRVADRAGTVREGIGRATREARRDVFVVSPYFVPGELGMQAMKDNRARGLRLRLLTNSLAATDEPAVHAGYIVHRGEMLDIGVEIFELSPRLARERSRLGRFGEAGGVLHAKVLVIDEQRLFIGSMNLDARSERYNTEIGVLIDSAQLAGEFLSMMDFESSAYRLRLSPQGRKQWLERDGDKEIVHDTEPEASWWRQLGSRLLGWLIPHDWL